MGRVTGSATRPLSAALAALVAALFVVPAHAQPTFEDQVMEMVNVERWNNGQLPPLKRCMELDNSAEAHSQAMADRDFFAHCDLDTHTLPWDRMTAAGYTPWSYAAENIAAGYGDPAAVMTGWMGSSGHRANILSTSVREIGIGYVYQSGDQANIRVDQNGDCNVDGTGNGPFYRYWTQNFGKINAVYPVVIEREAYETTDRTAALYVYGAGWAQEMRFRNEAGDWSAWEPYATSKTWTLSAGNGAKTVFCELRSGTTVRSSADAIVLSGQVSATPGDGGLVIAEGLRMLPAMPNPFRASTTLAFELDREGPAAIEVFDVAGRRVRLLTRDTFPAGRQEVVWDGRTDRGDAARPGIYFVRVRTAADDATVKVLLSR